MLKLSKKINNQGNKLKKWRLVLEYRDWTSLNILLLCNNAHNFQKSVQLTLNNLIYSVKIVGLTLSNYP